LPTDSRAVYDTDFRLEVLLRPPHPDSARLNTWNGPVTIGDGESRYRCGACDVTLIVGVGIGRGRHITARAAEVIARCYDCAADNSVPFVFG
jgi:hypothetical protein